MTKNASPPKNCFARLLIEQLDGPKRKHGTLAWRLAVEIGFLILLPLVAVLMPIIVPGWWDSPGEQMIVGLLKIASIALLGVHTQRNAPQAFYKCIGVLMVFVAAFYTLYLALSAVETLPDRIIYKWPHYPGMTLYVNIAVFGYMFLFLGANIYSIKKCEKNDLGARLFSEAFIFGVNIPSIVAFLVIIAISRVNSVGQPDLFLNGAMALLIFVSTAASICIDHFALPFAHVSAATKGKLCA